MQRADSPSVRARVPQLVPGGGGHGGAHHHHARVAARQPGAAGQPPALAAHHRPDRCARRLGSLCLDRQHAHSSEEKCCPLESSRVSVLLLRRHVLLQRHQPRAGNALCHLQDAHTMLRCTGTIPMHCMAAQRWQARLRENSETKRTGVFPLRWTAWRRSTASSARATAA